MQILHAHNFVIFNLCNDWRICSIEYSVRFAHTARVCRWRSKPIRALVKGSATRLLDTMASMCPTMVFVGHGINKCLRGYAPGMHECLQRLADLFDWAFAHDKLTVANLCVESNSMWTNFADNGKIHTRMYNVCTMYTTAVGVISPQPLACCLHRNEYDIWCNVCPMTFGWCWFARLGVECSTEFARKRVFERAFCSLRSHGTRFAYGRLRAQALSQPCLIKGRTRCVERCWAVLSGVNS